MTDGMNDKMTDGMTHGTGASLDHLFDVELQHQDGMLAVVAQEEQDFQLGDLVGSGVGRVTGPYVRGSVRWSNFERVTPTYCQLNLLGEIETEDGAIIRFDSRGFALPPQGAGDWRIAAAVRLTATHPDLRWLIGLPVVWEGTFDATTGSARYRAYMPTEPNEEESPALHAKAM